MYDFKSPAKGTAFATLTDGVQSQDWKVHDKFDHYVVSKMPVPANVNNRDFITTEGPNRTANAKAIAQLPRALRFVMEAGRLMSDMDDYFDGIRSLHASNFQKRISEFSEEMNGILEDAGIVYGLGKVEMSMGIETEKPDIKRTIADVGRVVEVAYEGGPINRSTIDDDEDEGVEYERDVRSEYDYDDDDKPRFEDLVGVTLKEIRGAEIGSEKITFVAEDGRAWILEYIPDCCAGCDLNEIIGDIDDLIGKPILMANLVTNSEDDPDGYVSYGSIDQGHDKDESFTWSFYNLATINGYVTLRWLGESNGYYSEEVSFFRAKPKGPPVISTEQKIRNFLIEGRKLEVTPEAFASGAGMTLDQVYALVLAFPEACRGMDKPAAPEGQRVINVDEMRSLAWAKLTNSREKIVRLMVDSGLV